MLMSGWCIARLERRQPVLLAFATVSLRPIDLADAVYGTLILSDARFLGEQDVIDVKQQSFGAVLPTLPC